MLRFNERLVLAKIESSYGVDPTPTGSANAMVVFDLEFEPDAGESRKRDYVKPTPGNVAQERLLEHCRLAFSVELQGSGAAGTAPAWGPMLRACGWDETVDAGVDVTYELLDPSDPAAESITAYFHAGDTLHKVLGWRGSASAILEPNGKPMIRFEGIGFYVEAAAASMPTPDFSVWPSGLFATGVNTPTFVLHGEASALRSLRIDQSNTLVQRDYAAGLAEMQITGRDPGGQISLEAPAIASKNWFAAANAQTLGVLNVIHGTAAGKIVEITCPKVQLLQPRYEDADNGKMIAAALNVCEDTGNDEIVIEVR